MKIRVHFDYEVEATREQLIEYLKEEAGLEPDDLAAMTDEELCAAINDYDATEFYGNWFGEKYADAIRMEIAHD